MELFQEVETALNMHIPLYIKNLLILNGFDTKHVLASLSDKDLEIIERFARDSIPKWEFILPEQYVDYYGPVFARNPERFQIVVGHRRLIDLIKNYFLKTTKSYSDKSTITDVNLKVLNHKVLPSRIPHASSTERDIDSESGSTHTLSLSTIDLTQQNSLIYKTIKAWARSKCVAEEWLKIKFDDIKVETALSSNDRLICSITCFCGQVYRIPQASKSDTSKPRWMYSNYHKHFLNKHTSAHNKRSSQDTAMKNKQTERQITLHNYIKTVDNNSCVLSKASDHNSSMTNRLEEIGDEIVDISEEILEVTPERVPAVTNNFQATNIEVITDKQGNEQTAKENCPNTFSNVENNSSSGFLGASLKWKSLKYGRCERSRRKRERLHNKQVLITSFYQLIKEIIHVIEDDHNLADVVNKTINEKVKPKILSKSDSNPASTSYFLNILVEIAKKNQNRRRNCFEEELKLFATYLYYTGGKLLYETLHANLNGVLPSITTLYRYKINNAEKMLEGDFNFMGLEKFLETRNLPKIVWISEDATRITGRIEYDPDSNKIVGFVLPFKDGFPDNNKYLAKSAKQIEAYFKYGKRADYAYVVLAQPLTVGCPSFCLSIYGTDNKFTYNDVLLRWKRMEEVASRHNIKILGFSSDGDTRLLKAMKIGAYLPSNLNVQDTYSSRSWFYMDMYKNDTCFMQDQVHILTKLRTRLLKPNISLPMGSFFVNVQHLHALMQKVSKDKHLLTKSDLAAEDKMNYESAQKICTQAILTLLEEHVPNSNATKIYLKLMNYLIASLIEKNEKLEERLFKIWYVIGYLRIWRKWIKEHPTLRLQDNFISSNCYTCIELNGHMLIKLLKVFNEDPNLNPCMFVPFLFNSQHCEKFFRATRSMSSTFSTVVNFSLRDFLFRADRIAQITDVMIQLEEKFVFPREKRRCSESLNTVDYNINISNIVETALDSALNDANTLGMTMDRKSCMAVDLPFNTHTDIEAESIECEIDAQHVKNTDHDEEQIEYLQQEVVPENQITLEEDLQLKDYSLKNVDTSENGHYLKLHLSNNKTIVVKKSTYCWLLDQGNGKVSADRLKRFVISKRKPDDDNKKRSKRIRKDHSTESDSSDQEAKISYDDSTDTEYFSSDGDDKTPECIIEMERYYAVSYDEQWYIGRIIKDLGKGTYLMKFLKENVNVFVWPENINVDIREVQSTYIFYGPLELQGTGPFAVSRKDIVKIKQKYKETKNQG